MLKRFALILSPAVSIVLLAVLYPLAQVDTAWVRRYNGPGNSHDYGHAMAIDDSGNVYVTGSSIGMGTEFDYTTIKYYPDGDTAWVGRYNGPGNSDDEAYDVAVDDSGNVYITGTSGTIKYATNGNQLWIDSLPGNSITVDDSGNVYVTGESHASFLDVDYVTIKYHPNGDTAWVRRYNGSANGLDYGWAIAVDGSGNVYVTGQSAGSGTRADYATIKYHPNGDTAWVRRYNGPGNDDDAALALIADDSGSVYVTGRSQGSGAQEDYATIKYLPNGDTAWVRRYNGQGNKYDCAGAIAIDNSGNVYVTGQSTGSGTGGDYTTIEYYPDGDTAWVRRYDGWNSFDWAFAVAVDGSGNVYVTGRSQRGIYYDYATVRYYPNGDTAWVRRYNGPGDDSDVATAIAVDNSGNVYVTGCSHGSGTGNDYCTIKYVQTGSGIEDETGSREKPSEFTLTQNYPNPFNLSTKIEFTLAKSGFVGLNIYDILGRKVRTLVSEHLSTGYKSVQWDGKNDAGKDVVSGIYFYQLSVADFSETKKLVLLK